MTLVSVIIPTYNRAALLKEAIDSVLNQTYQKIEVLVVDDGSSDHTAEIVAGFDSRVRFFQQTHAGPNAARNLALRKARGEFIALLDDDDLWLDFKIDLQVALLDRFPRLAYVFSDFFIFRQDGSKTPQGLRTWHHTPKPWPAILGEGTDSRTLASFEGAKYPPFTFYSGSLYHDLLFEPYVLPSSSLIRKAMITPGIRFVEDDFHCGDWEFYARLSQIHPAGFMTLETTLNRSHDDAVRLTRKSQLDRLQCRIGLLDRLYRADRSFYRDRRRDVDQVEEDVLLKIAKLQLYENDSRAARQSLRRWRQIKYRRGKLPGNVFRLLSTVPLGPQLLTRFRNAMRA